MYRSLLDKIFKVDQSGELGYSRQEYKGKVKDVFERSNELASIEKRTVEEDIDFVFFNFRMIRAVMDYKINNPTKNVGSVYTNAIQAALDIHRGREGRVDNLIKIIEQNGLSDMFDKEVVQEKDWTSWLCTNPKYSRKIAHRLAKENDKKVLFIPLGHGGVLPGMDAFFRYCDACDDDSSSFYPVRFSRGKLSDDGPKIQDYEIYKMLKLAKGARIVVYDEDTFTGETLNIAGSFFENLFGRKVETIANVNLAENPINCSLAV